MRKSKNIFFIIGLFVIMLVVGVAAYLYQVRQSFQEFQQNFQKMVTHFTQQARDPDRMMDVQLKDMNLSGDYGRIEHFMAKYFKRSLNFENNYRQQKIDLKVNHLFDVEQLAQDPTLAATERALNQADLLFVRMYEEKSQMFDQLLIDANQIELSTHHKTNQFHQNFDRFFTRYVRTQEHILNLEKQNLAVKRRILELLKSKELHIANDQLIFKDPADLAQFQKLQGEIKQTHANKLVMQEQALQLFLTLYS